MLYQLMHPKLLGGDLCTFNDIVSLSYTTHCIVLHGERTQSLKTDSFLYLFIGFIMPLFRQDSIK